MSTRSNVLQAIGNTSLVQLHKVVPPGCAKVFANLEWENPTGSMKDRAAQAMIAAAEEEGRLKPGDILPHYGIQAWWTKSLRSKPVMRRLWPGV